MNALLLTIDRGARMWLLPVFIGLCLVLGGSSREGILINGVLQMLACLLLVWAALDPRLPGPAGKARWLQAALILFAVWVLLSLLPLPPDLWRGLPGRNLLADGFAAIHQEGALPAMPLSFAPQETLEGLFRFLPPLAVFTLTYKLASRRLDNLIQALIIAIAVTSALLGWLQIFDSRESRFYFWQVTNFGSPVGLMANANHQALLLNCAIPVAAAFLGKQKVHSEMGDAAVGQLLLLVFSILVLVIGIIMAGSVAGYILLGPVSAASFLLYRGRKIRVLDGLIGFALALGVAGLGIWLASSPLLPALGITNLSDGDLSRIDTWRLTLKAAEDVLPFGSGLGSFEQLIQLYEDPLAVTGTFRNHAHNDYLELWLELGLPGAFILTLAVFGILRLSIPAWAKANGDEGRMKKAATIIIFAVLFHSIVDYPLRTGTMAVLVAYALGRIARTGGAGTRRSAASEPAAAHIDL